MRTTPEVVAVKVSFRQGDRQICSVAPEALEAAPDLIVCNLTLDKYLKEIERILYTRAASGKLSPDWGATFVQSPALTAALMNGEGIQWEAEITVGPA